jgi:hypothetical protein
MLITSPWSSETTARRSNVALENITVHNARFEVFKTVKIYVEVYWILTLCGVAEGYQHFGGPCCILLQGEIGVVKMETARSSGALVFFRDTTHRQIPEDLDVRLTFTKQYFLNYACQQNTFSLKKYQN